MTVLLTADEILAARAAIDPVFLDSPLMTHPALDDALGCAVTLKVETLNPIRSFKGRGTEAVLSALSPRPAAVVTASSGNFGQGIAWTARRRGITAIIFAPADANPVKVEASAGSGPWCIWSAATGTNRTQREKLRPGRVRRCSSRTAPIERSRRAPAPLRRR
jgi:threonine dehydratase